MSFANSIYILSIFLIMIYEYPFCGLSCYINDHILQQTSRIYAHLVKSVTSVQEQINFRLPVSPF